MDYQDVYENSINPPIDRNYTLQGREPRIHTINITDHRFVPFALTIRRGDVVRWVNSHNFPHTITSNDNVNSTGPYRVDYQLQPGQDVSIRFRSQGMWNYYCKLHSRLDRYSQPISPGCGPNGNRVTGISSDVRCGNAIIRSNYGTPMMGVITILN